MANKLLVSLPASTAHDGTELFYVEQGGNARQATGDQVIARAALKANNLSDLPSPATARGNLSVYSQAEVDALITALIDAAPGALDTLNELAAALGDDANFATTVTNALALKAAKLLVPSDIAGTAYTILATDEYVCYRLTNAALVTITLPLNATTAVPIGARIRLVVLGAAGITVAKEDPSITIVSEDDAVTAGEKAIVEIHKTGTDEWCLLGNFA